MSTAILATQVIKNLQSFQLLAIQNNCNHHFNKKNICTYCNIDGNF